MKRIALYGASDDLIEVESDIGADEIGCYNKSVVFSFLDREGRGAFELEMEHDGQRGWTSTLRFHKEREDGEAFPFAIGTDVAPTGYSWMTVVSSDQEFSVVASIDGKQALYSTDVQLINKQLEEEDE